MKDVLRELVRFALVTSLLSAVFGLLFLRGNVSALSDLTILFIVLVMYGSIGGVIIWILYRLVLFAVSR
jgi:hypothetical protein